MTISFDDIFKNPESYFFIQFAPDKQGDIQPVGVNQFSLNVSSRYPDLPFVGPRASQFGLRRRKYATDWAIVRVDKNDNPTILHHGKLNRITRKKRVIPFGDTPYYLILRGAPMYIHVLVSKAQTLPHYTTLDTQIHKDTSS